MSMGLALPIGDYGQGFLMISELSYGAASASSFSHVFPTFGVLGQDHIWAKGRGIHILNFDGWNDV